MRMLTALLVLSLSAQSAVAQVTSPATRSGRSTVYAPKGAVGTSQPLATGAALKVLEAGGNAFDAAVAAAAVLNVTEPYMTGIGGDMFVIAWSVEEGGLVGLDASGRSGSKTPSAEVFRAAGEDRVPYRGPRSVTVPGALSGWDALLERYGTLTLGEALEPAIRIAEEGFPVTPIIARDWQNTVDVLREDEGAAATFLIDGEAPRAGQWFANPDMARTFRRIADGGARELYGGSLGREIVDRLDALGGYITLEDLAAQEVRWVEPMSVDYKGYTLWELPPAGQGVAALEMLKMLEGFDLKGMGHNSAEYLHTLIEAKKLAYADLAYVADPDHMQVEAARLLDPDFVRGRAALIDPTRAAERTDPGRLITESETIYLSVADQYGNMVSFICSIYEYFGSGVVVPGTGFALQDRGAGFTLDEGSPNRIAPRKRPFHTIIPAFVTRDGAPWLSYGVMGGAMQPQGHVQVLLNLVEFGMDLQEAVDAARFRHFNGATVAIEDLPDDIEDKLRALGHNLRSPVGVAFGGAQAVMKLERGWAAGSDPRKDGMAAGH